METAPSGLWCRKRSRETPEHPGCRPGDWLNAGKWADGPEACEAIGIAYQTAMNAGSVCAAFKFSRPSRAALHSEGHRAAHSWFC
jgi:hypothetical protein